MIFAFIILLTAVMLSAVAAYYSIAGLTAIFAAAVIPVVIMGATLELGKVVATVWLHNNWKRINWAFKSYLIPAIVFLMILTSMGIFGFLSKAHSDQNLVSGDAMSKVAIYDEKITTEKENIAQAKKAIEQMNSQVDQMLGRSDNERGAERAVSIRKNQAKERAALQAEINKSQKEIQKLQEERAPIAAEFRKVEAEVGPIKYIAALLYGDNPDQNILERAVRWVIILIVVVFDPLALCLILAGNKQIEWEREGKKEEEIIHAVAEDQAAMNIEPPPEDTTRPFTEEEIAALDAYDPNAAKANEEIAEIEPEEEPIPEELVKLFQDGMPKQAVKEEISIATEKPEVTEVTVESPLSVASTDISANAELSIPNQQQIILEQPEPIEDDTIQTEGVTKESYRRILGSDYVEFEGKRMHERVLRDARPEFFGAIDTSVINLNGFGSAFPEYAVLGDIFIRTDTLPNRVFKFNGGKWIEVNKVHSDSYLDNHDYIKYLIDKISTGEIDPEMLSETEQDIVASFIRNPKT
jgi:hypothetical protein